MDWNETLQQIIDYVEDHLQRGEAPIDTAQIARLAGCSYGFFQKVFSYMNGISFAEYIRARKLTLAGYELKSSRCRVVDLSYKYGYESPTSFTKAFQQFHGVTPTGARQKGVELRAVPKMQLGASPEYAWRLQRTPALQLVGVGVPLPYAAGARRSRIPEFWSECQRNGSFARLIALDEGSPSGLFGLFRSAADGAEEYWLAVNCRQPPPEGFASFALPPALWAVFDCRGPVPGAIQAGWKYLYEEWLVGYPFQHAACPELEWYSAGNAYSEGYLSQIWIPIMEEEL